MFDIEIVAVGSIKNTELKKMSVDFIKRLSPYAKLKIHEIKHESFSVGNEEKAKNEESNRIQKIIQKFDFQNIFILTEFGKEFDSIQFSTKVDSNEKNIFVIGGTLGFTREFLEKYRNHLSLSKMTFPHELARVILLEQIYRASTIASGKTYHY